VSHVKQSTLVKVFSKAVLGTIFGREREEHLEAANIKCIFQL